MLCGPDPPVVIGIQDGVNHSRDDSDVVAGRKRENSPNIRILRVPRSEPSDGQEHGCLDAFLDVIMMRLMLDTSHTTRCDRILRKSCIPFEAASVVMRLCVNARIATKYKRMMEHAVAVA